MRHGHRGRRSRAMLRAGTARGQRRRSRVMVGDDGVPVRRRRCESAATSHRQAQRAADRQPADGAEVRERAVGCAPDDEARRERRRFPTPSCWSDALKLMKLPRSFGSTLPVTSAVAGPNRPGTNTKNSTDSATTQASGSGGRWVVDENRPDRDQREDREHALACRSDRRGGRSPARVTSDVAPPAK